MTVTPPSCLSRQVVCSKGFQVINCRVLSGVDDAAYSAYRAFRRSIFVLERGYPEAAEQETIDALALHIVAIKQDYQGIVGCARCWPESQVVWGAGRLAVAKDFRHSRVAAQIVEFTERLVSTRGATHLRTEAAPDRVSLFLGLGYAPSGVTRILGGVEVVEFCKLLAS